MELVGTNVDFLAISETKLDHSFPINQFTFSSFKKPYRLDVNARQGGIMVLVNSNIPSRQINISCLPKDIQQISIELNFHKHKWLIISIYKPPIQNAHYFLEKLSILLDQYDKDYENILILGDFNLEPDELTMKEFMMNHKFINLIKNPTCFKSNIGKCIDLVLTNQKFKCKNTGVYETGLSDHHCLIYSCLKLKFQKLPPVKFFYRDFKTFSIESFKNSLSLELSKASYTSYEKLEDTLSNLLHKFAPKKCKILRGNNKPHCDKKLRKEIMKRSRLKNIANKTRNPKDISNYKIQRNLVVKLNLKSKKDFFRGLDPKGDSKPFWKKCSPYFSNKNYSSMDNRVLLVENYDIISNQLDIANIFNNYFNTITDTLEIQEWNST